MRLKKTSDARTAKKMVSALVLGSRIRCMRQWLTQTQHGSAGHCTGRWWHKLRRAAGDQRRRKRRHDTLQLRHFRKLARGHEFYVVALVPDTFVNIKQRKPQHPDRSQHNVAALQYHLVGDRIPRRPGAAER